MCRIERGPIAPRLSRSEAAEELRGKQRSPSKLAEYRSIFDQAWEDYRRAVLYTWTYVVVIGGSMAADDDRGLRWMRQMVIRAAAALEDLRCLELL